MFNWVRRLINQTRRVLEFAGMILLLSIILALASFRGCGADNNPQVTDLQKQISDLQQQLRDKNSPVVPQPAPPATTPVAQPIPAKQPEPSLAQQATDAVKRMFGPPSSAAAQQPKAEQPQAEPLKEEELDGVKEKEIGLQDQIEALESRAESANINIANLNSMMADMGTKDPGTKAWRRARLKEWQTEAAKTKAEISKKKKELKEVSAKVKRLEKEAASTN